MLDMVWVVLEINADGEKLLFASSSLERCYLALGANVGLPDHTPYKTEREWKYCVGPKTYTIRELYIDEWIGRP